MKTTAQKILTLAACSLFASALHTFAIEGLRISVQCSNVVLFWPSVESETYIVQYRPTLDPNGTPWQTLTNYFPAFAGTNITFIVHSNIVQHPNCGGASGSSAAMGGGGYKPKSVTLPHPTVPLAMPADGSGAAAPLAIYPRGLDMTRYIVFDPSSGEWIKWSDYSGSTLRPDGPQLDDPQPEDGEPDGGGTAPETGFYRVVRVGVHLVGITNAMMLSGVVTIPVEVGADAGKLVALSVREDGSPIGNSATVAPFQLPLHVVLDTLAMSNGVHQISGFASWSSGGDEGSGEGVDAESPLITVTVHNEITFPNWIEHFGELYDSLVILAQSAHAEADWFIDVYGGNSGYIGTFGSHTDNGLIEVAWNLIGPPPNFLSYANEPYFDFVVTTEFADGPQPQAAASSAPKRTYKQTDNWTSKGMWVVANQQAWESMLGHDLLDIASDGFTVIAETVGLTVRPGRPSGESFRIGYGEDIPLSTRNSQWASLRSALFHQQSRNFFYLGHGAPDGIGGTTNTARFISASEIANQLHTIPAGQTNRHSYRFVFLYGCETATGTLPESFGMIHRENVPGIDFVDAALTPGAFVGWNQKEAAGFFSSVIMTDNANYLQHFQLEWTLNARGVKDALDHAKSDYTDVGFINRSKLKVFGNWELTVLGFNR